jgi:hypothetical protein
MRIDIRRPEGNTFAALGIATQFLRQAGASKAYIDDMARAVFSAGNAGAARKAIEDATGGAVSFYDSQTMRERGMSYDNDNEAPA